MAAKSGITVEMERRQQQALMKAMDNISSQTETGIKKVIAQSVIDIHRDTISPGTFPVVTGSLRASYLPEVKDMEGSVYSELDYAGYVEFGTGAFVNVPEGFEEMALRSKGKGIRQVNRRPQPHLAPAYERNLPRIDAAIDKLLKGVLR